MYLAGMTLPVHTVRRATINDLVVLRAIWQEERFTVGELERRFTEFQVVETAEGKVIAALALQIQGNQGFIHSEGFNAPEHTELLRDVLWERLKKVAMNHGLVRVWTVLDNGYWGKAQFREPQAEEMTKRPPVFGEIPTGWRVLQLKEEVVASVSLESELALFREAQKAETERFHQHARTMKLLATLIAFAALGAVVTGGYLWYKYSRKEGPFRPRDEMMPAPQTQEQKAPAPVAPPPSNAPAKPLAPKQNLAADQLRAGRVGN